MARKKADVKIEILADGVFVADDDRKDKGAIVEGVDPNIAAIIVKNGHGRLV